MKIGLLIFPDAEELDFVGPYEVFTMSNEVFELQGKPAPDEVMLISQAGGLVPCRKGMRVDTPHAIADVPKLDVLLVPGGEGTRAEAQNADLLAWITAIDRHSAWTTSVCTGSLVLAAAGLARGRRVTTHWAFVEQLRARADVGEVVEHARYVRDGKLVTAAGVSAGIDMALWLVGQMHGVDHARMTQRAMEYDPAPPYAALV